MIYIPCQHKQLHNGGWLEEQHFVVAAQQQHAAIAPCMLLCPSSGRVHSWLETLAAILHRRIVHETVLRRLLLCRYGSWVDFRSVNDLLRSLPVFYRDHNDRYFLLRDVIPFLPTLRRVRERARSSVAKAEYAPIATCSLPGLARVDGLLASPEPCLS